MEVKYVNFISFEFGEGLFKAGAEDGTSVVVGTRGVDFSGEGEGR